MADGFVYNKSIFNPKYWSEVIRNIFNNPVIIDKRSIYYTGIFIINRNVVVFIFIFVFVFYFIQLFWDGAFVEIENVKKYFC